MEASLIPILFPARPIGALGLIWKEPQGLGLDFTGNGGLGQVAVRDTTTPANNLSNAPVDAFLTQSGTSPKLVLWSDGLYRWTNHNLFVNSTSAPATQSVTLITGATYTYGVTGSGSLAGASGASGTATDGSPVTFVATGTSGTFTKTGSLTTMWINRGSVQTTPYHATGAAAWYAVPIEWDGVSKFYALVEPQATNGAIHSTDLSQWSQEGTVSTANSAAAPDGTTTATLVVPSAASSTHRVFESALGQAQSAVSIFAKAAGYSFVAVSIFDGTTYNTIVFSLTTGAVTGSTGTAVALTSAQLANGWWRVGAQISNSNTFVSITPCSTGTPTFSGGLPTFTGDAASGVLLWNAQGEAGAIATSPIPTFAATITRAADADNDATTTFPWSATAGTVIVRGRTPTATAASVLFQVDDGTANNRFRIERDGSNHINCKVTSGGVLQATLDLGVLANDTTFGVAFAWAANDFAASLNGAAVVTAGAGSLPTVTTMRIGYSPAGEQWNRSVKTVVELPRRMVNGDLVLKAVA